MGIGLIEMPNGVSAFQRPDLRRSIVVRPSRSEWLLQLKKILAKITKLYTDIHTDAVHIRTGYDVISYFRLKVYAIAKIAPLAASYNQRRSPKVI